MRKIAIAIAALALTVSASAQSFADTRLGITGGVTSSSSKIKEEAAWLAFDSKPATHF